MIFLKKAKRWGLISKNPTSLVDRPKAEKKEIKVWDVKEEQTFQKHAQSHSSYYIAFLLALTTEMR
ncbi:integrase family protein (plasmid) [Bacillus thuringiensis MC28]|nr:integrase family protein [Bacillus thuringiensis MC28]